MFTIDGLTFGIIICNDSNYLEPARLVAAQGATALFVPANNGPPRAKTSERLVAHTRDVDTSRAVENRLWIIRSDVAGSCSELISSGTSAIVNPDGLVVRAARPLSDDLLVAEIE